MEKILSFILIMVSALLMGVILMQSRGVGLSATFGGEGNVYRTKRGAEKFISVATVVLAILFVVLATLIPLLPRISVWLGM